MKYLLKQAAGAFSFRLTYTLLTFITSIIMARVLGADGFGTYTYVVSWAYLLAVPSTFGFDGLLNREVPKYQAHSFWDDLHGLIRWAKLFSLLVSLGLAGVAAVTIWYLNRVDDSYLVPAFWIAMISVPFTALRSTCQATTKGFDRILLGLLPEMLLEPFLLLLLIGALSIALSADMTVLWAVGAYSTAVAITLFASSFILNSSLPIAVSKATPRYQRLAWTTHALPFILLESIHVLNARIDILMIGALQGVEAAGIYAPVNRGAQLVVFILMAFGSSLLPKSRTVLQSKIYSTCRKF